MYKAWMFCQFFVSSNTRKLAAKWMLYTNLLLVIFSWPSDAGRYSTFFTWNLITDFTSSTLVAKFSLWVSNEGNLPVYSGLDPGFMGSALSEILKPKRHHTSWPTSWLIAYSYWVSSVSQCGEQPQCWPHYSSAGPPKHQWRTWDREWT